jgi:hypothetical protein
VLAKVSSATQYHCLINVIGISVDQLRYNQMLQKGISALIAYHYFDYKDNDKRHVRGLLKSVLFQLSGDSDRCRGILH